MLELTPSEIRRDMEIKQSKHFKSLKHDWVERVKLSDFMDLIIFDEGDILGDDWKRVGNALAIPASDPKNNKHLDSGRTTLANTGMLSSSLNNAALPPINSKKNIANVSISF
jgi:hypothetical protein